MFANKALFKFDLYGEFRKKSSPKVPDNKRNQFSCDKTDFKLSLCDFCTISATSASLIHPCWVYLP